MPSYKETFGIAYIEALSQGLPVIYSRGQGVDGYFEKGTVGEATDPASEAEIAISIRSIISRLENVRKLCIESSKRFGWPRIAGEYLKIYGHVIQGRELSKNMQL
jgi:glycosyltransferase involved in cell wall biosynthesis